MGGESIIKDRKGRQDMRESRWIIPVIVSVLGSAVAFADCVDGVRKWTSAEVAYFQKVQAALKEVLPSALCWACSGRKTRHLSLRMSRA